MSDTAQSAAAARPNRFLNISLWAAQLLVGISFSYCGALKLTKKIPQLAQMMPWTNDLPEICVRGMGIVDIMGGLGILLPSLTRIRPGVTRLAALGCVVLQISAGIFHVSRGELGMVPMNVFFGVLSAFVLWGRSPTLRLRRAGSGLPMPNKRQPAIFISHGGGPCFSMDWPGRPFENLREYLTGLIASLPEKPRAILVISAHWEEPVATIGAAAKPGMIFDYYGFPPHTYELEYPAPGDPALAGQIADLLKRAGIVAAIDTHRGYDHGVFVPMMVVDPEALIPVVTLSLRKDLDPAAHIAMGRALAPLRDQNVLILGSGNSYHNLGAMRSGPDPASSMFEQWLTAALVDPQPVARDAALLNWSLAPGAHQSHPREEHLLPLMIVAGAAGDEAGSRDFYDVIMGNAISGYRIG